MVRVQALGDSMRSRNNTVYMFSYFIGGAAGSFLGTLCFQHSGWYGVCAVGLAFQNAAILIRFFAYRSKKHFESVFTNYMYIAFINGWRNK